MLNSHILFLNRVFLHILGLLLLYLYLIIEYLLREQGKTKIIVTISRNYSYCCDYLLVKLNKCTWKLNKTNKRTYKPLKLNYLAK